MNADDDSTARGPANAAPGRSNPTPDSQQFRSCGDAHQASRADDESSQQGDRLSPYGARPGVQADEPTDRGGEPREALGEDGWDSHPLREIPDSDWQPRSRHDPQPTLAETPQRGVPWLWPGRIAMGRVTLLVGDPGVGKSLLALDVAARVSAGRPWPDQGKERNTKEEGGSSEEPRVPPSPTSTFLLPTSHLSSSSSVLILSAEDDAADTIRPRLEALGAHMARIVALPPSWSPDDPAGLSEAPRRHSALVERSPSPRPLDLRRDVAALEDLVVRQRGVRLVIIDPLSAYLGRNIENSNGPVRQLLLQLGKLAARRRLAVLAISHLRKRRGSALHRTMGSLAFVAAARTSWLVGVDPHDGGRRLMLPMKNNLAPSDNGLSFTIASAAAGEAPVLHWSDEPVAMSADEALNPPKEAAPRPRPELDDAVRWLRVALADGVQLSRRIERSAEAHGIRLITLRRAFRELAGEAVRTGFGPMSAWHWRLPGIGPQEPPSSDDHLWEF